MTCKFNFVLVLVLASSVLTLADESSDKETQIDLAAQQEEQDLAAAMRSVLDICDEIEEKALAMHEIVNSTDTQDIVDLTESCFDLEQVEEDEASEDIQNMETELESEVNQGQEHPNVEGAAKETEAWIRENLNRAQEFYAQYKTMVKVVLDNNNDDDLKQLGEEILELAAQFEPVMQQFQDATDQNLAQLENQIDSD